MQQYVANLSADLTAKSGIYPNNLKILVLSCCGKAIAAGSATGLKALEAALALVALE